MKIVLMPVFIQFWSIAIKLCFILNNNKKSNVPESYIPKKCDLKNCYWKFWLQRIFEAQNNFTPIFFNPNIFWPKKLWDLHKFATPKFVDHNFFWKHLDVKMFGLQLIINPKKLMISKN